MKRKQQEDRADNFFDIPLVENLLGTPDKIVAPKQKDSSTAVGSLSEEMPGKEPLCFKEGDSDEIDKMAV